MSATHFHILSMNIIFFVISFINCLQSIGFTVVAQGCSLSPILFLVFINDLLKEQAELGIQLK